jgi:hypothetical protein
VALPLLYDDKRAGTSVWIEICLTQYILVAINLMVQTSFLCSVYIMTNEAMQAAEERCDELSEFTLMISLWAFVVTVLTDIQETWDLLDIIVRQFPTQEESTTLVYRVVDRQVQLSVGGPSKRRKFFLTVFLVIPKFIFACTLLVLGSSYLVFSESDADIILNCFALVFILQIDELIFKFLSPPRAQRMLEAVPPFMIRKSESEEALPKPWGTWKRVATPAKLLGSVLLTNAGFFLMSRCGQDPTDLFFDIHSWLGHGYDVVYNNVPASSSSVTVTVNASDCID